MKTTFIVLVAALSLASAQTPFVSSSQRATNTVSITITEIYEQAQVMVQENGQLIPFPPTVRLVSRIITTNAPVAAAEHPTKIPSNLPSVPPPPSSNSMSYVNWVMRNNVTNALPPAVPTNSPIFRRFSEWKKTIK